MSWKRWFVIFLVSVLACAGLFTGFNCSVDAFGVFGDHFIDWYSYNMTQNPRVAKIVWLDRHWEDYDSYIIGSSKTSSFPAEYLNAAYGGASFYNMLMYGGDFYDIEATARYVLENYNAKNIIINTGFEELTRYDVNLDWTKSNMHAKVDGSSKLRFYSEYLFAHPSYAFDKLKALPYKTFLVNGNQTFIVETGAYNKAIRDLEPVQDIESYMEAYPKFTPWLEHWKTMDEVDACLASIARIKAMCEEAGASFTVVISSIFDGELDSFYNEDSMRFLYELAGICDYWDFSGYTPVSVDPRFYYDYAHFRNSVGAMMITRMFGGDLYVPDGFGEYVTAENVAERLSRYHREGEHDFKEVEQRLPVLLYYDVAEGEGQGETISAARFGEHMAALKGAGMNAVTTEQIRLYVFNGIPLPENPVLITFDGGYAGAVALGGPILREHGMCATVFADVASIDRASNGDTDGNGGNGNGNGGGDANGNGNSSVNGNGNGGSGTAPAAAHFTWEQARGVRDVFTVQSQGYDVSRAAGPELGEGAREGALQKPGETESEYIEFFRDDIARSREGIERELGYGVRAYAFPLGLYRDLTRVLVSEAGAVMTFTRNEGVNTLVRGLPQSLLAMSRISPDESTSPEQLIDLISN